MEKKKKGNKVDSVATNKVITDFFTSSEKNNEKETESESEALPTVPENTTMIENTNDGKKSEEKSDVNVAEENLKPKNIDKLKPKEISKKRKSITILGGGDAAPAATQTAFEAALVTADVALQESYKVKSPKSKKFRKKSISLSGDNEQEKDDKTGMSNTKKDVSKVEHTDTPTVEDNTYD